MSIILISLFPVCLSLLFQNQKSDTHSHIELTNHGQKYINISYEIDLL